MILRIGSEVFDVESAGEIRTSARGESRTLAVEVQNGSGQNTIRASRDAILLSPATLESSGAFYFSGIVQSVDIGAMITFSLEG